MKRKTKTSTPVSLDTELIAVKPTVAKHPNGKSKSQINTNGLDLTDELDIRELLKVLSEVKNGNFTARMPIDKVGVSGKICDTLNEIIGMNEYLVQELTLARNTIGKQGHLNHRVELPRTARGSWTTGADAINSLISDLVHPTIEIAHVISSVAKKSLAGNAAQNWRPRFIGRICQNCH